MTLDFEKCWCMINDFFSEEFEAAGEMRKIGATRRLIDKLKNFQQAEESANIASLKTTHKGLHLEKPNANHL